MGLTSLLSQAPRPLPLQTGVRKEEKENEKLGVDICTRANRTDLTIFRLLRVLIPREPSEKVDPEVPTISQVMPVWMIFCLTRDLSSGGGHGEVLYD